MLKSPRTQSLILRYGIAVTSVAIALLLTLPLSPLVKPTFFPLFFGGVIVSAWYGGLGFGLLATGLSVVAIDYFSITAAGILVDRQALSRQARFFVAALLTSTIISAWKRADRTVFLAALRGRSRHKT